MSLHEVLEAVRTLSPEDRAQVKALLDSLPVAAKPPMTEEQYAAHLATLGVVTLPEPVTNEDAGEEDAWEPVEVTGQPLSQMIIAERR